MKHFFFCSLILIIGSCKESKVSEYKSSEPKINFDWLLGNWQRSNDKPGQKTYEQWSKKNDSLYLGLGYTMKGLDTIWQENVKLMKAESSWVFSAISKGESKSTDFVLKSINNKSFTCENPSNEFPKKIEYELKGDSIKAIISGGGPIILFLFGKPK